MATETHTWHKNTFGILYGATTKTACGRRIPRVNIVGRLDATCVPCQDSVIADLMDVHEMHQHLLEIAKAEGFKSIPEYTEWLKRQYTPRTGR